MNKKTAIKLLKKAVVLMELHEHNPFKIRGYLNAAASLENHGSEISDFSIDGLQKIDGIGKGMAENISSIYEKGTFPALEELESITPEEVYLMTRINGFGPKKIKTLWSELNVQTLDELIEACRNNRIAPLKGFGEKSAEKLLDGALYLKENQRKLLYPEAEKLYNEIESGIRSAIKGVSIHRTGELARCCPVVNLLEIIITSDDIIQTGDAIAQLDEFKIDESQSGPFSFVGHWADHKCDIRILLCKTSDLTQKKLYHDSHPNHLVAIGNGSKNLANILLYEKVTDETEAYNQLGYHLVPPVQREGVQETNWSADKQPPVLVEYEDLKGCLHNHSTYSDGKNTIEEMAQECIKHGLEYFGISDHSQTAVYANGLGEEMIYKQLAEIDALNQKLAPFKILKGIESDILSDGALDYPEEILKTFDFIVASVHSNLNMDFSQATNRLIKAIENPYTSILGHMTGRILLKRNGFPVDFKKIIDACAANKVIIELNSNPKRMDVDWRWMDYMMQKGVLTSINPDAHEVAGISDMKYGIYTAQKGGITKEFCLNAQPLEKVMNILAK